MRRFLVTLVCLGALCSQALACDDWTHTDSWLLAGAETLLAVDWAQSKVFLHRPNVHETNPLLGRHPGDARLATYMATVMIAVPIAACWLPPIPRKLLLGGVIDLEIVVTTRNYWLFGTWGF